MSLEEFTTIELQQELQKRNEKKEIPRPVAKIPDFSILISTCKDVIDEIYYNGVRDEDSPQHVYEAAMIAVFGSRVFDWINDQMK